MQEKLLSRLSEFNTFNFNFIFNQLVNVGYNCRTLDIHKNKRWG